MRLPMPNSKHPNFARVIFALVSALCLVGCQRGTDSCSLGREADVPVDTRGNVPLVSAVIDGHPVRMMLDTGAEHSLLTVDAIQHLGIKFDFRHRATIQGVGPAMTAVTAPIDNLEVGGLVLHDRTMIVVPIAMPNLPGGQPDGFLGADIISHYDVDLDLPHGRMTLYHARLCPEAKPPWNGAYLTFNARRLRDRLHIPIKLDGKVLAASLDTGTSAGVTINAQAAERVGVTAEALTHDRRVKTGGVAREKVVIYLHRFNDLKVGTSDVHNPLLPVASFPSDAADALIGFAYLRTHRVWLSFATPQVFIATPTVTGAAGLFEDPALLPDITILLP